MAATATANATATATKTETVTEDSASQEVSGYPLEIDIPNHLDQSSVS